MRVEPNEAEIGLYTWGKLLKRSFIPQASYAIDVSGLRDPQSNRGFKKQFKDGRAGVIQEFVREDPRYQAIRETVEMLAFMHLRSDGRDEKWLSIGLMDYHGLWIAPALGESIADVLSNSGYRVSCFHYDVIKELLK